MCGCARCFSADVSSTSLSAPRHTTHCRPSGTSPSALGLLFPLSARMPSSLGRAACTARVVCKDDWRPVRVEPGLPGRQPPPVELPGGPGGDQEAEAPEQPQEHLDDGPVALDLLDQGGEAVPDEVVGPAVGGRLEAHTQGTCMVVSVTISLAARPATSCPMPVSVFPFTSISSVFCTPLCRHR